MSVSDNFNRADGGLGANWTLTTGSAAPQISSNAAIGGAAGYNAAHWSANSFNNDQTSQITKANASNYFGPSVRHTASGGGNFYTYLNHGSVQKIIGGFATDLTAIAATFTTADVAKIAVVGTTITVSKNGTNDPGGSLTDSALSSGNAGIAAYGDLGTGDDWLATGEIGGGGGGGATYSGCDGTGCFHHRQAPQADPDRVGGHELLRAA